MESSMIGREPANEPLAPAGPPGREPGPKTLKELLVGWGWAAWLGCAGIGLLFVALRWNNYDAPLIRDEGENAYAGQLLLSGLLPYQHSFLQKPPMVAYSYALAGTLAPHVFWAPRILAYLFVAGATGLLGFIARHEFGPGVALPAMWLVTPMVLLPSLDQFPANTEMFMLLPLMATLAIFVVNRNDTRGWRPWCAAGFLGAVTLCYKYTALPVLALAYAAWSIHAWRASRNPRVLARNWLALASGAVLAAGLTLGYFLARGAGSQLWDCTIRFNRFYARTGNFGLEGVWPRLEVFGLFWWILIPLPLALLFFRPARVWFWGGLFAAACVATGLSLYGQYYIVLMPFWALLSAAGLVHLSRWAAARLGWPQAPLRTALLGVTLVLVCRSDVPWLMLSKQRFAAAWMGDWSPFREALPVARRVAELASPGEAVFVAGSEPELLCYANRFSPSRFVNAYPLMVPTPLAATYQQEAIRELERYPPALIVYSRTPSSWLQEEQTPPAFLNYLQQLLAEHYQPVGGYVVQKRNRHWEEPMTAQTFTNSSLVIFQRKGK